MSLSLLSSNACSYVGCGLHFRDLYDLIAHIEFTHIPVIEQDHQQKLAAAAANGDDTRTNSTPNLPLSCFQRVFPTPYRPNPIKPEVVKVSFNHYRKRAIASVSVSSSNSHSTSLVATPRQDDEFKDSTASQSNDDLDECALTDPEMRFRCNYVDCGKRYKNVVGLRIHMRASHGLASADDLTGAVVTAEGTVVPAPGSQQPPTTPSPTKYAASRPYKCQQCSKRYKTTQGLQNHAQQAHQKVNPGHGDPPPAVVQQLITQARAHGQQALQAQQQAALERANLAAQHGGGSGSTPSGGGRPPPLPVSVASQQQQQSSSAPSSQSLPLPPQQQMHYQQQQQSGHLPVRSIHVQPNRIIAQTSSGHVPIQTTGQMLQQQIMQQRRQQAHQLQQQQQQQQHQQSMQYSSPQYSPSPSSAQHHQTGTDGSPQLALSNPSISSSSLAGSGGGGAGTSPAAQSNEQRRYSQHSSSSSNVNSPAILDHHNGPPQQQSHGSSVAAP